MPDPSVSWCYETYGNYEMVRGRKGEFCVCRLPDGKLYECWYLYYMHLDGWAHPPIQQYCGPGCTICDP